MAKRGRKVAPEVALAAADAAEMRAERARRNARVDSVTQEDSPEKGATEMAPATETGAGEPQAVTVDVKSRTVAHVGMKARFGGVSKKKAFGFSVRLEARPLRSLIEKLLELLVEKRVDASLMWDPNADDDADGQAVIDEEVTLCTLDLVAGCRGFSVRADHIAFRLRVDPATIGDSEILALAGHKGWIELREHSGQS